MTEQEKQLKKIQLYQDIDLLEKDFLKAYPVHYQTGDPIGVIKAVAFPAWLYFALAIFFIWFVAAIVFQRNENDQFGIIVMAITFLVLTIMIIIIRRKQAPRTAQYQIDKAAYDQRHAELRRQYDAL